ncbi:DUF6894 family protein [Methylobacterium sp. A49B]
MMRFFFDTHAGSLSEWDDVGAPAVGIDEAVAHARYLLMVLCSDSERLGHDLRATIMIRDWSGIPIATVTSQGKEEPRVIRSGQR